MGNSARDRLGYVDESDVDLVLVLDADSDGPMTNLLLQRVGFDVAGPATTARSTLRNGGERETDVEFSWEACTPRHSLLIEDKIDAHFTPGQFDAYREEVEQRRSQGEECAAVLVCPSRSRERYEALAGDAFTYVTCEDLIAVAKTSAASGDRLARASILVLQAACEPRPGTPIDPTRLAWGDAYRMVLARLLPPDEDLRLAPRLLKNATSEWVKVSLGGTSPTIDGPWHWLPKGIVCAYVAAEPNPMTMPEGATTRKSGKSGKSWIIELAVPPVTFDRPAPDQEAELAVAVLACLSLRDWSKQIDD